MRYNQPVSQLKEAANPSHAHNLPRGYMGGGEGSGSSSSGGGFLGGGKHRRGHLPGRQRRNMSYGTIGSDPKNRPGSPTSN